MKPTDHEALTVPDGCVQWCRRHADPLAHQLTVFEDCAEIDLDWWNTRLGDHNVPVTLRGRDPHGRIVAGGAAAIKRGDLRLESPLYESESQDVGLLYLCAAWLQAHRTRDVAKRFPVTSNRAREHQDRYQRIGGALRALREHSASLDEWPAAPGAGVTLMAAFTWAADTSPAPLAQLIDKQGVAQLVREGWLETASVHDFTYRRYLRYTTLLHTWARQASVPTELVEMWLIERWRSRRNRTSRSV